MRQRIFIFIRHSPPGLFWAFLLSLAVLTTSILLVLSITVG